MFKKSFLVILIQLFGTVLSFLSIYLIAGDMSPEVYSLVGVYVVVANIMLTFSDLGLETTMMREALYWMQNGDTNKVSEYTSQAILSRIIGFCVLSPFIAAYLMIINHIKYEGQYTLVLLSFLIGAAANALNEGFSIIVRSQGGYVFSQLTRTINSYFLKFAGIGLYIAFGAKAYMYFYGLSSIPLLFVYFLKLRKVIDFHQIHFKDTLKKIYMSRYLWLKTDLDYFKNNADSLLVSAVFPAAIMGSYTIFKNFEQISKSFIEGFFDVLSQNSVKYKGNPDELKRQEKKFKQARNAVIVILVVGLIVFEMRADFFINLVHLAKYEAIEQLVLCVIIVSIIHLIGKYETNALAFFATSKINFDIGVITFVASIASFLIVFGFPNIGGVMMQRIAVYGISSLVCIILFRKNKQQLYTQINQ